MLTNLKYLDLCYFLFLISLSFSCTSFSDRHVLFTKEELLWLENKDRMIMSVDNTYPPLSFHDDSGELTGLNIDLIKIIENKIGIPIIFVGGSWNDALKKAMNHEVDGVINATPSIERKDKLNFTINFIQMPRAFIARKGTSFDLQNEHMKYKIAGIKGTDQVEKLRIEKTQYEIIEVSSSQEAFKLLLFEEVDMIYHDLAPAQYLISTLNLSNFKIVSVEFDAPSNGIGLRNDDNMLLCIMNKAINGITRAEMSAVKKKWIAVSENEDHTLLYGFSIILIIMVVSFMILNWSLRNSLKIKSEKFNDESQERKKLQLQLAEGQQKLIALIKNGAFELSLASDLLKETNDDLLEGKMGLNQTLDFLSEMGKEVRISDKKAQLHQLNRELIQNKIINLLRVIKDGLQVFLFELKSASVDQTIVQNPVIDIVEESIEKAIITADSSQHFEISQRALKKYDLHEILDKSLIGLNNEYGASLEVIKYYSTSCIEVIGEVNKLCEVFKTLVFKICESLAQVKIRTGFDKNQFQVEIWNDLFTEHDKAFSFQPSEVPDLTFPLDEEDSLDIHIAILIVKEHQGTIDFRFENKDLIHVLIKFPKGE